MIFEKKAKALLVSGSLFILLSGIFQIMALSKINLIKASVNIPENLKNLSVEDKNSVSISDKPLEQTQSSKLTKEQQDLQKVTELNISKTTDIQQITSNTSGQDSQVNNWIKDFQSDLENYNLNNNPKETAISAIDLSKKWIDQVNKAHSDAFFGKQKNSDELFDLLSKTRLLKTNGNRILDEYDVGKKGSDFFIRTSVDSIKTTITQLKRITKQLNN